MNHGAIRPIVFLCGIVLATSFATAAPYPETILFRAAPRNDVLDGSLYVMRSHGTDLQRINVAAEFVGGARWSPDGRRIAYSDLGKNEAGPLWERVRIADDDGDNDRIVFDGVNNVGPSWSPDGRQLVMSHAHAISDGLMVIDADGKNPIFIGSRDIYETDPDWSPEGSMIVFSAGQGFGVKQDIFVCKLDGSDRVQLTHLDSPSGYPRWSPDGTKIAFTFYPIKNLNQSQLWVMNADGSSPTQVEGFDGFEGVGLAWSPTGNSLVCNAWKPGEASDIYVVNLHTGRVRQVTNTPDMHETVPEWFGSSLTVDPASSHPVTWCELKHRSFLTKTKPSP